MSSARIAEFWSACRARDPGLPDAVPAAWAFGATPEQADELLELVLGGVKTATASALWDYEAAGEPLPGAAEWSILLDGSGAPRAVIQTTRVQVLPFAEVDADHAHAEGEGDRTLAHWHATHERFWREHPGNPRGFTPDLPVVCERFRLVLPS